MSHWFVTSDAHLFDDRVSEMRGFSDSGEWGEYYADMYCSMVGPNDIVDHLGDMTKGGRVDDLIEYMSRLPGRKRLKPGNHCPIHPAHRNSSNYHRRYLEAFEAVEVFGRRRINGRDVLMSHFPYVGDHREVDRWTQYRLRDEGRYLLHGHTHSSDVATLGGRQIHVGLDAWGLRLVTEAQVSALVV